LILVACEGDEVVGTLQLTFTPSLSYQGGWRATVESVRTEAALRGRGIGTALMHHAIELARQKGCVLMQLTTNQARTDAHRFYERLGFKTEHLGMKLRLGGR
jgi:GNAT superfamily N-acetyltransferase